MSNFESPDLADGRLIAAERRIAELEMALDVLSATDGRTGLASRNALIDAAGRELHRIRRYGGSFGVLVCRLTPADDAAHIGALTAAGLRNLDLVATWGEWFIGILFEGLGVDNHSLVWERIRPLLPVESAAFAFADPDSRPELSTGAEDLVAAAESLAHPGNEPNDQPARVGVTAIGLRVDRH